MKAGDNIEQEVVMDSHYDTSHHNADLLSFCDVVRVLVEWKPCL